jgi:hypothetical protein
MIICFSSAVSGGWRFVIMQGSVLNMKRWVGHNEGDKPDGIGSCAARSSDGGTWGS